MAIRQISLNDFRNLKSVTLNTDGRMNYIIGKNASGKTNLLEAIYILCHGQSFKTRLIDQCIQQGKKSFLLFGQFTSYKAGISRSIKNTTIRINNETIYRISTLAEKTPVRIINASSFDLILGSPSIKREYIDWCLFHVEHDYHLLWNKHRHGLKQKNALLKQKNCGAQLDYWDEYLEKLNLEIHAMRLRYTLEIKDILIMEFIDYISEMEIELTYLPGWDTDNSLLDIYRKQRSTDLRYGFSRYGSHRDDIKIFSHGLSVQNILSRGQIKKLAILLVIAQVILIKRSTQKNVVLLIDDLDAELDEDTVRYILEKINIKGVQIFITGIVAHDIPLDTSQEYKMFHVEHGIIKSVKNT